MSFRNLFRGSRARRFRSARGFDPSLYLIVGSADLRSGGDLEAVAVAAVQGGVTLVQLREKDAPLVDVVALARALKARLAPLGVPLIINDSAEAVLAADADGLHVGQDDMPALAARMAIGRRRILGVSAGTLLEARVDGLDVADYVGAGPVYGTATKADAGDPVGPEGIRELRGFLEIPLVAIGGVTAGNAAAAIAAGADGVAVVSAICGAADPQTAARDIRRAVEEGRAGRGSFPHDAS